MHYGMPNAIKETIQQFMMISSNQITLAKQELENQYIEILKQSANCPTFTFQRSKYGYNETEINNWNQSQKWLLEKKTTHIKMNIKN